MVKPALRTTSTLIRMFQIFHILFSLPLFTFLLVFLFIFLSILLLYSPFIFSLSILYLPIHSHRVYPRPFAILSLARSVGHLHAYCTLDRSSNPLSLSLSLFLHFPPRFQPSERPSNSFASSLPPFVPRSTARIHRSKRLGNRCFPANTDTPRALFRDGCVRVKRETLFVLDMVEDMDGRIRASRGS